MGRRLEEARIHRKLGHETRERIHASQELSSKLLQNACRNFGRTMNLPSTYLASSSSWVDRGRASRRLAVIQSKLAFDYMSSIAWSHGPKCKVGHCCDLKYHCQQLDGNPPNTNSLGPSEPCAPPTLHITRMNASRLERRVDQMELIIIRHTFNSKRQL